VAPRENQSKRAVTFNAQVEVPGVIAQLYDWLGTRLSVRKALDTAVQEVLSRYYPH
jgi:hypothetical protein